ncbi:IclR family transcriptional regulator [Halobacillus campisalis]|uniref:IclR family transcriptional regulator n=1 Tax=Halobacillus campisalis TaxID=435909 RepID=A0ABW2K118_9BACI|nr:IclR family transcriptional regulator [Halobacillus campisalis]
MNINKEENHVQSVVRAAHILQLVANSDHPITINQLSEETNLNRTTVWRLLETLEFLHYVERDLPTKGYQLGYAPYRLFSKNNMYLSLIRKARPLLEKLRDEINETVLLSVPKHNGTLTIDQIDAPHSIRPINLVNRLLPSHCTSNGKLLLSRLSIEEFNLILDRELEPITRFTITDPTLLQEELNWVRDHGFSLSLREWDESENGMSVEITDNRNELIGFISLLGPYQRLSKDKMLTLAPKIKSTAKEIAEKLS